jgi:hypothetical protein
MKGSEYLYFDDLTFDNWISMLWILATFDVRTNYEIILTMLISASSDDLKFNAATHYQNIV